MRRVSIRQVRPGMIVARPVIGSEGQCLLNSGIKIKPYYIKHLLNLDVGYLYVHDERFEGVEVRDVVAEETRLEACYLLKQLVSSRNGTSKRVTGRICSLEGKLIKSVTNIVDELFYNKDTVINLVDIRCADNYTFAHCVNVCVLSTLMAIKLDYSKHKVNKIALGAMLHDLGKVRIPDTILKKPGFLTDDEFKLVKNHPTDGYDIFRKNSVFSAMAGDIIAQHHERYNGSGYPLGLKGNEISPLAQIVAIADVYDALTSDRPYRRAYQPHEAIEMFSVSESSHNIEFMRVFLSFIAGYPVGTQVRLSNNDSGVVVGNTPGYPLRPTVRVLYTDKELNPHPNPYEIDLTEKLDIIVSEIIESNLKK